MKRPSRPRYVLTIERLPRADDPDGIRRLRRFLKAALRSYGLRCVGVVEAQDEGGGAATKSFSESC